MGQRFYNPAKGVTLKDKIVLNDFLLGSGLDIHGMNSIRRLFSQLKGGRLAKLAAPARITQFLLSDVPDDRPESIASGPAVADPVPLEKTLELIYGLGLDRFDFVSKHIDALKEKRVSGPLRPGDTIVDNVHTRILASNKQCREATSEYLLRSIPNLKILPTVTLSGEASKMAVQLAEKILEYNSSPSNTNYCFGIVAGGETTVTLDTKELGLGGRSQSWL